MDFERKEKGSALILELLIAALIVVAAGYGYVAYINSKNTTLANQATAARQKVESAFASAQVSGDQKLKAEENLLLNAGIVSTKLASSKVDVCYVDSHDQGAAVTYWYQSCYVRYVTGFETDLSKLDVEQKVSSLSAASENFGTEFNPLKSCEIFEKTPYPTLYFRPAGTPLNAYQCGIPQQNLGEDSITGPIVPPSGMSTKTLSSFNPATVDNSKNQVWIQLDEDYYSENLGCKSAATIFCDSPRTSPIM